MARGVLVQCFLPIAFRLRPLDMAAARVVGRQRSLFRKHIPRPTPSPREDVVIGRQLGVPAIVGLWWRAAAAHLCRGFGRAWGGRAQPVTPQRTGVPWSNSGQQAESDSCLPLWHPYRRSGAAEPAANFLLARNSRCRDVLGIHPARAVCRSDLPVPAGDPEPLPDQVRQRGGCRRRVKSDNLQVPCSEQVQTCERTSQRQLVIP